LSAKLHLLVEFSCDFYFGNKISTPIKKNDYKELSSFRSEFKRIGLIGNFYWLKGPILKLLGRYDVFVLTGEPYCVSNWLLMLYCCTGNGLFY
jgi:hypothetical protein